MKKLYPLFLLLIFAPTVASAAWWNPASWFSTPVPVQQTIVGSKSVIEDEKPAENSVTSEAKIVEKVVEKIVEKPVIQTITVQDPTLQVRINTLVAENDSLKAEIDKLLRANKSLDKELLVCENKPTAATHDCDKDKELIVSLRASIEEISKKHEKEIAQVRKNSIGASLAGANEALSRVLGRRAQELRPFEDKLKTAMANFALYCQ